MGLFDGIKQAQATKSSSYIQPGQYLARIDKVKASESRNKIPNFIIEMTALHHIAAQDGSNGVGNKMTHIISRKQEDYFLPNIKGFLACAVNVHEDEITEEVCIEACGEDQPLEGRVVEVHAQTIITQQTESAFTKVSYMKSFSYSEVASLLTEAEIKRFYPDNLLDRLIKEESEE
jgi:hypothetical protein|tara:strand:+ start:8347 stop:8874 length:528 start_codon:yes stop_codon:yes gene_type:complete